MKVLFVSSGNTKSGISPIVNAQGESIKERGVEVEYFTIEGKGINGYLKNIKPLKAKLRNGKIDIIHSHYSLSAFVSTFANFGVNKKHVVSLMGSDVAVNNLWKFLIKLGYLYFWDKTIVKSVDMKKKLPLKKTIIIPNGVSLNNFILRDRKENVKKVGFDSYKKNAIWVSNPKRDEKNFRLAKEAFRVLNSPETALNIVNGVSHDEIPKYFMAADVLLLTSLREGSPNVVKEAMACNLPVVSTNVGDVEWLFGNESGHFLTSFKAEDVAEKIKQALDFKKKYKQTNGRNRIIKLGLDSDSVAPKIIGIYENVLSE